jgi:predicted dehydrogenase
MSEPLRIGVLGAARISGASLTGPARATGHRVVAVAAGGRGRAAAPPPAPRPTRPSTVWSGWRGRTAS